VLVLRDATPDGDVVADRMKIRLRHAVVDVGITAADVKASPVLRRLATRDVDGVPVDVLPWKAFTTVLGPAIQRATPVGALVADNDGGSAFFLGGDHDFG
jgi:hypothetical protein